MVSTRPSELKNTVLKSRTVTPVVQKSVVLQALLVLLPQSSQSWPWVWQSGCVSNP